MSVLLVDCETYCDLDIAVGSRLYAQHPSCEVLMWSVRSPEWSASLVYEGRDLLSILRELKAEKRIKWTKNEPVTLVHWSPFDRMILEYVEGFGLDGDKEPGCYVFDSGDRSTPRIEVYDLQTLSLVYGGPAQLEYAARFFGGLTQAKHKDGKKLIKKFCTPEDGGRVMPEDDPVGWRFFVEYARQDTDCMVPTLEFLQANANDHGESMVDHWPAYRAVERMNERGTPIDLESATAAFHMIRDSKDSVLVNTERNHGINANSVPQVRDFLGLEDCQRDTLEEALESGALNEAQTEVCEARLLVSGAAVAKLKPMVARGRLTDPPRVFDAFRYWGAWTGRLTSMGLQLQNFVRHAVDENYFEELLSGGVFDNPFRETRNNIRGFIQSGEEDVLVASDYNAIECRVAAWIAGETWLLEAFEKGADPYLIMASEIYGDDITDKEDPRRQFGKTVELGSQYQLGWRGLMKQCLQRGIELTEEEAKRAIDAYRAIHPMIVSAWADFDDSFHYLCDAEMNGQALFDNRCEMRRTTNAIKLTRPSGRSMWYWLPRAELGKWPDEVDEEGNVIREGGDKWNLKFTGRYHDVMTPQNTYGGNLFQGVVQGTAADLMLHGMLCLEDEGWNPVMSVHDEVVCEHPRAAFVADDEDVIEALGDTLCVLPDWAEGLPVVAEGWMQRRFTK